MDTNSVVRKVLMVGAVAGLIYSAEKLRPFDYIFPDEGDKAINYATSIESEDVKRHPEEFAGLAKIVLKELPEKHAIDAAVSFASKDSTKEKLMGAIYSNTKSRYGFIEGIVSKSTEKEAFYMCELGFMKLPFGQRAKLAAYGAMDILGADIVRPD